MERFFDLAIRAPLGETQPAGYVGTITANSFMKREFGKKLIEEFIPRWDLTHVIDTSGAYIPGHGTPTVILFGHHRPPVSDTVRAVLGIRGEPETPEDPTHGLVWSAIVEQVDVPGSQSAFVSVADMAREGFHSHPWSIGGGGAAELKEQFDEAGARRLGECADSVGITSFTLEDDVYILPRHAAVRWRVMPAQLRTMIVGDAIRDWQIAECDCAVFPYDADFRPLSESEADGWARYLWPARTSLANNKMFGGKTKVQTGLHWYEYGRLTADKLRTPLSITFAFVATHNHFVLDRGGKVFNRTAPVIKLARAATEEEHLALLGLLNCSIACFWMKQTFFDRGNGGIGGGIANEEWERFFEHDATKLLMFPISESGPIELARLLDANGSLRRKTCADAVLEEALGTNTPIETALVAARDSVRELLKRCVAAQEELDWACYGSYGLIDQKLCYPNPETLLVNPGERAFEIALARKLAQGQVQTAWFDRHESVPTTRFPAEWPADYCELVEKRISLIESDPKIALVERPEFKRRWSGEPWEQQQERALREWLLNRLESATHWPTEELRTAAKLADAARDDADFMQVAELYRGRGNFDLGTLVAELVESESVPFVPVLRYKPTGLGKRAAWEQTWDLQRREDAIDVRTKLPDGDKNRLTDDEAAALKKKEVGDIPVPPRYTSADFLSSTFWRLRGKLDVPKERFISYPFAEREADPTLVIGWAGWDHLQQAKALAAYYVRMKEQDGWTPERLQTLLAGLLELLPWLKQWHNEVDPAYGIGMGDYFAGFVDEEARALGVTLDDLRAWQPPSRQRAPRRRRQARV